MLMMVAVAASHGVGGENTFMKLQQCLEGIERCLHCPSFIQMDDNYYASTR